ncbi:MAG: multidrug effflux MFS transporter [Deltaproteobacteria bacterium]|nr:multidrug effflux MFS transporter [Deltaproteobacteria bacterium]
MATLMSLVALSIDAMLPALGEIGRDLGVQRDNDVQLVVSLIFLGIAAGQLVYGPISDSVGRKPTLLAGLALFMVGCLLSLFARSFSMMLAGRLLQGLGIAGPRIVTVALIRDRYEGRLMARVMSFAMAVFIIVPILAPAMGQGILLLANWRTIFGAFLAIAAATAVWFWLRQPETLPVERRVPFTLGRIFRGFREVLATRTALGYTIAAGFVFAPFVAYLSMAQQMFQGQYGVGKLFPLYFALLAIAIGAASLSNTRLVMRYGMKKLAHWALVMTGLISAGFFVVAYLAGGHPPLWVFLAYLLAVFFCEGILFGNMNALAMEPLGHIAGIGAAVVGSLSTAISIAGGSLIGQAYNGTILPFVAGYGILGLAALAVMHWTESEPKTSGS